MNQLPNKNTSAKDWMTQVKLGIDYRKKYSSYQRWRHYRDMYRGDWPEGITPVNRIFSYGRTLIPRTYFRAPRVSVTATRPELVWHAKVVEAIDNMLIQELKLKKTIKTGILSTYLTGIGAIKLGYDSEFGYIPDQAVLQDGETATSIGQKTGGRLEYRDYIKPGLPWAAHVPSWDLIVPWGAKDPQNLPWICHRIIRPLADIKEDQKYVKTGNLQGTLLPDIEKDGSVTPPIGPDHERDKQIMYGELFEIRDFRSGAIIVICEDTMLLNTLDVLQIESLPYEFITFNEDIDYFWPIADCKILEPHQEELNEVRTQTSRHRAIALIKFLARRGVLKPEEQDKLLSGLVGPFVELDDVENVMGAIETLQPHIPPDLYRDAQFILTDMRESLGFSANQLGEYTPQHNKTAREAGIVDEAFDVRVDERKDIVSDTILNIIQQWNQYIFKFWTKEKVIQIVSPQGEPAWINYTGTELEGKYNLTVDMDSSMPLTKELKFQISKDMYSTFNGDPMIDQMMLRQVMTDQYSQVHPLAQMMIKQPPEGLTPDVAAAARQPEPMEAKPLAGMPRGR